MTVKQQNILRCYWQATGDELQEGLRWYANVNQEAQRLALEYTVSVPQAAGIIAAVSPGLRWDNNVEAAERILTGSPLDGLGIRWYDGVKKARRIKRGHSPLTVLKGNKVRAFFACIVDPAKHVTVCIDGHAYSIWYGRRITLDSVPTLTCRLYNRIASDYVTVARELSIAPCQLQAVTWLAHRRIHNV